MVFVVSSCFVGNQMSISHVYASYLMNAANVYAAQQSSPFKAEESWFERRLMALFEHARKSGVEKQDIALIASTALAVILTRPALPGKASESLTEGRTIGILSTVENEI